MIPLFRSLTLIAAGVFVAQVSAQVTLYEQEGFAGRSFTTQRRLSSFDRFGLGDGASSVVVSSERWEVCEDVRFGGRCLVLRPGSYPSFGSMGLDDGVLSVRPVARNVRVADDRYAPAPVTAPVTAQVTFYERESFAGRSITTTSDLGNLGRFGSDDRATSAVIVGTPWEFCENVRFSGRCIVLRPGRYASLAAVGLNGGVASVRNVNAGERANEGRYSPIAPTAPIAPPLERAQITFYEREGFAGRSFNTAEEIGNFERVGFNDLASSVFVTGGSWEVCEYAWFGGRCVLLRPGRYPSLAAMGLNDRISSVRAVNTDARLEDGRYRPDPVPVYDPRRRGDERLYEATVTSVRAVVGTPGQRCWVEREQAVQDQGGPNLPAAIAGALIGGILGHQVGGGRGKDVATAGGAVAGAALGANIGRDGGAPVATTQNMQRCDNTPGQARPDYWDVTYNFRGQEHRVQMSTPPRNTVTVNEQGEPRV